MPIFQGGQIFMGSGVLGSETMVPLGRITNASIGYNLPRTNVTVLGRGKPLEERPIINFAPVDFTAELIKNSISTETILGMVNALNVTTNLVDTSSTATYGVRNVQVRFSPTNSPIYNGQLDLKSGVLNSYSIQGTVGDTLKTSLSMQFLDMSGSVNATSRPSTIANAGVTKPEGQVITGIQFSGYGVTGMNIQSFSFGISFARTAVTNIGSPFPVERPFTDVGATLQIRGFIEGINNSLSGLSQFNAGLPTYETVALILTPSCSTAAATTITITNPYLDSQVITPQIGNYTTAAFSFSMPIGPNPSEITDGSAVTIT